MPPVFRASGSLLVPNQSFGEYVMKTQLTWMAAAVVAVGTAVAVDLPQGEVSKGEITKETSPTVNLAKSQLDKQDEAFIQKAAQSGLTEAKLGELASQKASAAEVKEFGQMMVRDHGKANQELNQLAETKGVALAAELDDKNQSTLDRLGKLSAEEFDKAYASQMVIDHRMAVLEFEKASKSAKDTDLKNFASKTLPTLQSHLEHAQGLMKAKP
jgi:putative membrane protein